MKKDSFKVVVPGSIMLLGEHAVLHGYRALACAIDQYIYAELTPASTPVITLSSDALGSYKTTLRDLAIKSPFQFALAAISQYKTLLPHGFELHFKSDFSHQVGLGSSAAVTVATMALLQMWLQTFRPTLTFFQQCLSVVHAVQHGLGSGADLAASIWGGIISINPQPLEIEQLSNALSLALIYTGSKMTTEMVLEKVSQQYAKYPDLAASLYKSIGECSEVGYHALLTNDDQTLGDVFKIQQALMEALGVSNNFINQIIVTLENDPGIRAAKISGSGLGDCVVGLGTLTTKKIWESELWKKHKVRPITIKISSRGLAYDA